MVNIMKVGAPKNKNELIVNTQIHRREVIEICQVFCKTLMNQAQHHDWSKFERPDLLFDFLSSSAKNRDHPWLVYHRSIERHHAFDDIISSVNFFDMIELICDWISASFRYEGDDIETYIKKHYDTLIVKDVLFNAFLNTYRLLRTSCKSVAMK